ncbi:DUF1934 domain-containing protein [Paenibacillus spongiae]|uniref:DUF1934 domain-containing protein n=1 Tax=Paenibacillus spongiae TaxID=2909671 RepID=A0ABY5SAJ5_9BACL|nr:DUF1934 domain-containing protein [Paenibacillus spongiae]UVI30545.1 DUF1934 domain-containing protein [Paenibacillus spongiae]
MNDRARVRVTLESEIDGQKQVQQYTGEWFRKERTVYVKYEEADDHYGEVRTLVRLRDGELNVTRRGGVESEQTFMPGSRRSGRYASPHARFAMETETTRLRVQSGGRTLDDSEHALLQPTLPMVIEWHYSLHVGEQPAGDFMIRMRAEEWS